MYKAAKLRQGGEVRADGNEPQGVLYVPLEVLVVEGVEDGAHEQRLHVDPQHPLLMLLEGAHELLPDLHHEVAQVRVAHELPRFGMRPDARLDAVVDYLVDPTEVVGADAEPVPCPGVRGEPRVAEEIVGRGRDGTPLQHTVLDQHVVDAPIRHRVQLHMAGEDRVEKNQHHRIPGVELAAIERRRLHTLGFHIHCGHEDLRDAHRAVVLQHREVLPAEMGHNRAAGLVLAHAVVLHDLHAL
mmetsp:Transcript_64975/g.198686  ORF Transcript_64975/g.198686 Transcript_64975/m.198686 type:complete len:242 (-) Transcript_64975:200-925(-)